ncbi:MAG: GGDEF domain-containing protein [Acidobacteria bacterium]|nr:GGDEF domain-containing protein [Acidobacteriota bacterium]
MKALFRFIDNLSKPLVFIIAFLIVFLFGELDKLTGFEISFSIFYLIPVSLTVWFCNRNCALFISVMSAAVWLWADLTSGHSYSHFAIPIWNSIMRLGFFLMAVFLLDEIKKLLRKEQQLARHDYLTGVLNSMEFAERAKIEIERSQRFNRPLTIAYIDVDNFKEVNDTFGHSRGDQLLRSIAKTLKENTRSIDLVSRLGGDEFAILFPETDKESAKAAVGKLQTQLATLTESTALPISFSIGAVVCHKSCEIDNLIREADALMYQVKKNGKNGAAFKEHP